MTSNPVDFISHHLDDKSVRRYKIIACEILFREISYCAAQTNSVIDTIFLPKGLHDVGEVKMAARIQQEIDSVDITKYQAILLGYALCNNGIRGLSANIPLVVPRAHDCITLLLGSRSRYDEYFNARPGTYFKSTGWIERDSSSLSNDSSVISQLGMNKTYDEYVRQYGEENAKYLMETMGDWLRNYSRLAYIDMKIGNFEKYRELVKTDAQKMGFGYEELEGSTGLLQRLLDGDWSDDDFLVVKPGQKIAAVYDGRIVTVEEGRNR